MKQQSQAVNYDMSGFLRLRYPSIACRPVPSFNLIIPPNWVVTEFPNSLFVMGSSNGKDGSPAEKYWSNVIVHHERVLPSMSFEELAPSTWEALQGEIPGVVLKDEFTVELNGLLHFVREVEIPGASPEEKVTRLDSFMFGPTQDHPTLDLFRITWLHPTAAGEERKALYFQILESLKFD